MNFVCLVLKFCFSFLVRILFGLVSWFISAGFGGERQGEVRVPEMLICLGPYSLNAIRAHNFLTLRSKD